MFGWRPCGRSALIGGRCLYGAEHRRGFGASFAVVLSAAGVGEPLRRSGGLWKRRWLPGRVFRNYTLARCKGKSGVPVAATVAVWRSVASRRRGDEAVAGHPLRFNGT